MNDSVTTTSAEDAVELSVVEDGDEGGAIRAEFDVPGASEDTLLRVLHEAVGEGVEEIETLDELFSVEDLEQSDQGVPVQFGKTPMVVYFRHIEESRESYGERELRYRAKNKLDKDEKLKPLVEEAITREALYGNSITGWDNAQLNGSSLSFNRANYRRMWTRRRFRNWALAQIARIGGSDSPALEQIRGN